MALEHDRRDELPFDLAAGDGVWDSRRIDEPQLSRLGLGFGGAVALLLATGGGVAPRLDPAIAIFYGIAAAVLARWLLLARQFVLRGGWRTWRRSEANGLVVDRIAVGTGTAVALLLVTGGGGVGPTFALGIALMIGALAGIATRATLLFLRWP